ncbi:MAG: CPCC family cysteine-rich protein [Gammaproteobacteria bacterium]
MNYEFDEIFPCPCCGYRVFDLPPGHHGVCPICAWEDDMSQLRFAEMPGSANPQSLIEAQANFEAFGASNRRYLDQVRSPNEMDSRDPRWRRVDARQDNLEQPMRGTAYADSYPVDDPTVLYYWRPEYWRRLSS